METTQRSPVMGAITLAGLLFLTAPLLVVVLFSFHATASLSLPFTGFSLRWYEEVLSSATFRTATWNSFVVASAVAVVTAILGTMAAYGLSRATSRLKAPLAVLFFLPITLPGLFLGLGLLVFFARLDIKLSLVTVAIGHAVYVLPYYMLIAKAALDRMDSGLEEVAADLGADRWTVFRRVTLPQIWPVLAGATCLAFALSFDEFVITFFVTGSQSTLPLYVWSSMRRTIDPSINTISTLLMLVTLLIFAISLALTSWGAVRRLRMLAAPAAENVA